MLGFNYSNQFRLFGSQIWMKKNRCHVKPFLSDVATSYLYRDPCIELNESYRSFYSKHIMCIYIYTHIVFIVYITPIWMIPIEPWKTCWAVVKTSCHWVPVSNAATPYVRKCWMYPFMYPHPIIWWYPYDPMNYYLMISFFHGICENSHISWTRLVQPFGDDFPKQHL